MANGYILPKKTMQHDDSRVVNLVKKTKVELTGVCSRVRESL